MNKKFILGLGSVVLLASSLVAGDVHYDRGNNVDNHKKSHKEIKRDNYNRDYHRGNHYGSRNHRDYVKNRHNIRHYAKNRYHMKKRDTNHMRRIARNEFRHAPRHHHAVRDDRLHRAIFLDLLSHNARFHVSF